ncbi:sugar transferase [Ekhidna sp.]|uniref:sugar transferase n=1 Tax=Ekhidna sp. TaxID=2608089 RepID=UPI003518D8B8
MKPILDWVSAILILLILFPLILFIALILFVHFRRNPFFVQKRIGKSERAFRLIKFRSMREDELESSTTRIGRFIRATSLDELPQLINVLKFEMSLVGPRPLLEEYLPYYNEKEKLRHTVRPGITGLAQVNGRNSIDWGERMNYDISYAKEVSFLLDLRIIVRTFGQLTQLDKTTYKKGSTIKFSEYAKNR